MMHSLKFFRPLGAGVVFAAMGAVSCADAPSLASAVNQGSTGTVVEPLKRDDKRIKFQMVRSTAVANAGCLPDAQARVRIEPGGPVEVMTVDVSGLPPIQFDFFVIQVPDAPFGLSWYQGDIETDCDGNGHGKFIGRFNVETFIVAPGVASAPVVHDQPPFPDADSNPATAPSHLPPWPMVQLAGGRSGSGLPWRDDAVQRRPHSWSSGAQHAQLRARSGTAAPGPLMC